MEDDIPIDALLDDMGIPKRERKPSARPLVEPAPAPIQEDGGQPDEAVHNVAEAFTDSLTAGQKEKLTAAVEAVTNRELSAAIEEAVTSDPIRSSDAQSYEEFRKSLGLPSSVIGGPAPIALGSEPFDRMAAVYGGVLMKFATDPEARASMEAILALDREAHDTLDVSESTGGSGSPSTPPGPRSNKVVDLEELDEDGVAGITLAPGGQRDITKSPKHHELKLDNWAPAEDDADDVSDLDEGEWVDVGGESTGASPTPTAKLDAAPPALQGLPAQPQPLVAPVPQVPPPPQVDPFHPKQLPPPPKLIEQQQQRERQQQQQQQGGDGGGAAAVEPFTLDPNFDYDAPVPHVERFSVARALREGEYYDRLCQEAVSPHKQGRAPSPPELA